jgi:hypothetical protein
MNKYFTALMALASVAVIGACMPVFAETVVRDNRSYPLPICPVTGQALDAMGGPVIETINEREVRFCCAGCVGRYRANIEEYEAKVDAAIIEQQREQYPTDRCVVMDTALGSMGDPMDHVHGNRLVRFCCAGCVRMFTQDPKPRLAKLDAAAIEKARDAVPETCVVTGDALGDTSVTLILGNRALSLHSEACVKAVADDPAKYLDASDH